MKFYSLLLILAFFWNITLFSQVPFGTPDNVAAGNCLEFDGNDDHVRITDHTSLDITNNITLEAWVKIDAKPSTNSRLVMKAPTNLTYSLFNIDDAGHVDEYDFRLNLVGSGVIHCYSTGITYTGNWEHIAGTYDGTTMTLYINGEIVNTSAASGLIATSNEDLFIGGENILGSVIGELDGRIDEVRIWSIARSQQEIKDFMCQQLTGNESGLVSYWNMNEGSGNTVNDVTTNANHGIRQ